MKKIWSIIIGMSMLIGLACTSKPKMPDWILGTWKSDELIYEAWEKQDDNLYTAKSFIYKNGQPTIKETIELILKNKELFYIPTVKNQNEGKPVEFKLVSTDKYRLTFENKNHDFPQRIIYERLEEDKINTIVEGPGKDGKIKRFESLYRKQKNQ